MKKLRASGTVRGGVGVGIGTGDGEGAFIHDGSGRRGVEKCMRAVRLVWPRSTRAASKWELPRSGW